MNNKSFYLEEKDVYKLFNQIKFDENDLNNVDEDISEIQKERIKKNLNKKVMSENCIKAAKHCSIAAAVLLVVIIGIGAASPALAKNIPIINSITQMFSDRSGYHGEYALYSQLVDKSVTDNGITVTINEAIADDSKIILGYTIKSDKKIKNLQMEGLNKFLKINGNNARGGSGSGDYADEYTYVGSNEINYDSQAATGKLNIDLNINDIMGNKGKWDFAFSVSKDELLKDTTAFNTNAKISMPDFIMTVDKVVLSPIDTIISMSGNYKDKKATGAEERYSWIVYDDRGVELIYKAGNWDSDPKIANGKDFIGNMQFDKMKRIPKYLTAVPYVVRPIKGETAKIDEKGNKTIIKTETNDPGESKKIIDGKYPIELSQGKMGKLIIKEIKTENGSTYVKFTAKGKAPYFQAGGLCIKDSEGEVIAQKNMDIRKDEDHPDEFTMEFSAFDSSKQYSICTTQFKNVEIMDDLKFKIELNK